MRRPKCLARSSKRAECKETDMSVVNFIGGERVAPSGCAFLQRGESGAHRGSDRRIPAVGCGGRGCGGGCGAAGGKRLGGADPERAGRNPAQGRRNHSRPGRSHRPADDARGRQALEESRGETLCSARVLEFYAAEGLRFGGENPRLRLTGRVRLYDAQADRQRRIDHALEFPDVDRGLEDRAGARHRQ